MSLFAFPINDYFSDSFHRKEKTAQSCLVINTIIMKR